MTDPVGLGWLGRGGGRWVGGLGGGGLGGKGEDVGEVRMWWCGCGHVGIPTLSYAPTLHEAYLKVRGVL